MRVFLDDVRMPYDVQANGQWRVVRNAQQFKDVIVSHFNIITDVAFDHDLGMEPLNGAQLCRWMCEFYIKQGVKIPNCTCHSYNPEGKKNIISIFTSAQKVQKESE